MITKKQMEKIAEILRRYNASSDLIIRFASWLEEENPRFDWDKFAKACTQGVE